MVRPFTGEDLHALQVFANSACRRSAALVEHSPVTLKSSPLSSSSIAHTFQAIAAIVIDSDGGVVKALGSRGLAPEWGPRDPDFFPQGGEEDPSSVLISLDLVTGEWS